MIYGQSVRIGSSYFIFLCCLLRLYKVQPNSRIII